VRLPLGSHLRATPTKLSQNPLLPASVNLLVPPCTASTAIAAVITAVACTAISTAVTLFLLHDRVVCPCRLQFRLFFVFSASPLLLFVAFPMSLAPYRLCLCPAPLSPFGASFSEPRKTKLVRAWSRGPRCPPPCSTSPLPGRELPLARPSLMSPPPALPPTTTRCCFPLCR
jgi:hypothetical protein